MHPYFQQLDFRERYMAYARNYSNRLNPTLESGLKRFWSWVSSLLAPPIHKCLPDRQ